MIAIVIPQLDANSESALLVRWEVDDGAEVRKGDLLCSVETSKALYDVEAEGEGIVVRLREEGEQVDFNTAIGYIAADSDQAMQARSNGIAGSGGGDGPEVSATKKARELAARHGVDLVSLGVEGIITEEDVMESLKLQGGAPAERLRPGTLPAAEKRVVVIGAGYGAMQVIDILLNQRDVRVIGCLDDDPLLHGVEIFGVPVLGGTGKLEELFRSGICDHAIVAISTSIPVRRKFHRICVELGLPMANAIDPGVRINRGVVLGAGNIICSGCHLGVAARLGDNNFISAHNSIDHHNAWGSHITTGPAVATSGAVTVGDGVKFGTGIFIQPNLTIGADATIASGAIIIHNIPANSIVRTRIQTEVRGPGGG